MTNFVVPAKAGTQWLQKTLDSRFRGNDGMDYAAARNASSSATAAWGGAMVVVPRERPELR